VFKDIQRCSDMAQAILRLPTVQARTGLSRSTIYLQISQGIFPKPVNVGARAVGWLDAEVDEWIARRAGQRPPSSTANGDRAS
jgi:prophage regulatory protein